MTTKTTTVPFLIQAIPNEVLTRVRAGGAGASGDPVERFISEGGDPLRCCLRDAEAGEELILFGYEPPIPPSPYREVGAVLAHARPCGGPAATDRYPPDWYGRRQVLRAYDRHGRIHDATTEHDGRDPETVIAELLAVPGVERIHSRNVTWGCFMFTIIRPDGEGAGPGTT